MIEFSLCGLLLPENVTVVQVCLSQSFRIPSTHFSNEFEHADHQWLEAQY